VGASLPPPIWMGKPIQRTGFRHRVLTKYILPMKPYCCCTKPTQPKQSHFQIYLQNLCPLPPEKWPSHLTQVNASFLLYFKSQLIVFIKMCKSQTLNGSGLYLTNLNGIGLMLFYLTSAVTHLSFYIMRSNHKQRYSCWFFQRYIFTSLVASEYERNF